MKWHACEETLSRFQNTRQLRIVKGTASIERAVRTVDEMVRTLKLDLEARISETLKITHKVIPWLIEHAVDLVNKIQVGQDGKTCFERVIGNRFNGDVLRFASPLLMRVAGKVQGGVMSERWFEGLYMEMRFRTNEAIVLRLSDGVMVRTRSIQRQERDVTIEMLGELVGVPGDPQEWFELELTVGITTVGMSFRVRLQAKMDCL